MKRWSKVILFESRQLGPIGETYIGAPYGTSSQDGLTQLKQAKSETSGSLTVKVVGHRLRWTGCRFSYERRNDVLTVSGVHLGSSLAHLGGKS